MGTFFEDILTGGGAISARQAGNAFGEQQRLNELAQQQQQQGIDYYLRYGQQAEDDRGQARQGNQQYGQMGLRDRNLGDYNLGNAYAAYARANNLPFTPTTNYTNAAYPNGSNSGASATNRTTPNTGARSQSAASVLNNRNQQGVNTQQLAPPPAATQQSPYALTEVSQQALNQQVDRINSQRQTALANYRAQAAQTGMSVNPAMEQYINEHYDTLTNEQTTQAAERAREQVSQAAAAFIQQFTNQRNLGTVQYGDSLDRTLQIASQALQQGANAPYFTAANQTQNMAGQMGQIGQQLRQQSGGGLSSLLKLAFALSGGFGGLAGAAGAASGGGDGGGGGGSITLPEHWGL